MSRFGIIITILYIGTVVYFRGTSFPELKTMPLNEFGDFFAGVFGPLMLFWLILGYIQQQKELRQNTKALELQADELRKSVEQHKELVAATKEQVQADLKALEIEQLRSMRESQPVFKIVSAGWSQKSGSDKTFSISIINSGSSASSVKFSSVPEIKQVESSALVHYFDTGQQHKIGWSSKVSGEAPLELKIVINCRDSNTNPYTKTFDLILDKDDKYQIVSTASVG